MREGEGVLENERGRGSLREGDTVKRFCLVLFSKDSNLPLSHLHSLLCLFFSCYFEKYD